MARKRNGKNDPRAQARREAAYGRGAPRPDFGSEYKSLCWCGGDASLHAKDEPCGYISKTLEGSPLAATDALLEDPHREDDQDTCVCGIPRWEHKIIVSGHAFKRDPNQNWAVSRAYSAWIGNAGLEEFYDLPS